MRTEQQERSDRLAARARKKKGTKGNKQQPGFEIRSRSLPDEIDGKFHLRQVEKNEQAEKAHREFEEKVSKKIREVVEACKTQLPKVGSFLVRRDTSGFEDIVLAIKGEYYGTEFAWGFTDAGFVIARKVK